MTRLFYKVVVFLALLSLDGLAKPKKPQKWYSATVRSINVRQGKIILVNKKFKKGIELQIPRNIKVRIGGRQGTLADLKVGQKIRVRLSKPFVISEIQIQAGLVPGRAPGMAPNARPVSRRILPGKLSDKGGDHLAFSPDGASLVLTEGTSFGGAHLWDLGSRKVRFTLDGRGDRNPNVLFSPDGKYLVSAMRKDNRSRIDLWDAATGKRFPGFSKETRDSIKGSWPDITIYNLAYSPDGSYVATNSADSVHLWSLAGGMEAFSGEGMLTPIQSGWASLAFSPTDNALAVGDRRTVHVFTASRGIVVGMSLELQEGEVNSLAFSPDGRTLAVGTGGVLRKKRGRRRAGKRIPEEPKQRVGDITFWRVPPQGLGGLRAASKGSFTDFLLESTKADYKIEEKRKWKGDGYLHLSQLTFGFMNIRRNIKLSRDGNHLLTTRRATTYEYKKDKTLEISFAGDEPANWRARKRKKLFMFYYDRPKEKPIGTIHHAVKVNCVRYAPAGKVLAYGTDGALLILVDARTRKPIKTLRGHESGIRSIAFSPDGRFLASAGRESVRLWEVSEWTGAKESPTAPGQAPAPVEAPTSMAAPKVSPAPAAAPSPNEAKAAGLVRLAKLFLRNKQVELARTRLQKAIEQYPESRAAKEAKQLLATIKPAP